METYEIYPNEGESLDHAAIAAALKVLTSRRAMSDRRTKEGKALAEAHQHLTEAQALLCEATGVRPRRSY